MKNADILTLIKLFFVKKMSFHILKHSFEMIIELMDKRVFIDFLEKLYKEKIC